MTAWEIWRNERRKLWIGRTENGERGSVSGGVENTALSCSEAITANRFESRTFPVSRSPFPAFQLLMATRGAFLKLSVPEITILSPSFRPSRISTLSMLLAPTRIGVLVAMPSRTT